MREYNHGATRAMPFGKYRGQTLDEVPGSYLAWLLEEARALEPGLQRAIRAELAVRIGAVIDPPRPGLRVIPEPPIADAAREIVTAGYHALALRHHPDRGGDHHAMLVVNSAKSWLAHQLKEAP